jgi:hypothetical protein
MIMDQQVTIAPEDVEEDVHAQITPVPIQKRKRGQRKEGIDGK